MINLGDKCRDQVTGFEGVATARFEYMNGCVRYMLEAGKNSGKEDNDIDSVEELVFDQQRLTVVQPDAIAGGHDEVPMAELPGGARTAPPRTGAR